jgi:hypothetical protein
VTVRVSVTGGTAARGTDYTFADTNLVLTSGQTNGQVLVTLIQGNPAVPEKTIEMSVSLLGGPAVLGSCRQCRLTITKPFVDSAGAGLPAVWENGSFSEQEFSIMTPWRNGWW